MEFIMFNYCTPKLLQDLQSTTFPDGKRYYTLPDGTRLPSVTTVIGATKKAAIMAWRKRVGEEKANQISRKASGRGTNVHSMCEEYLNNEPMTAFMPDAIEMFLSIKPYLDKINNIWYQECALYSKKLGVAGRVDCIAEYEGVLSVIDFKTSSRLKDESDIQDYFAQECAYALMLEEMIGTPIHQLVTIMAVEDNNPLIFIQKTEDHIESLVNYINYYNSHM